MEEAEIEVNAQRTAAYSLAGRSHDMGSAPD